MSNNLDTSTATVTARGLETMLIAAAKNRDPALITGAPGVGKSAIVELVAKYLKHDLVIAHPVVMEPIDIVGIPGIVDGQAEFLPYGIIRKILDAKKPTIFFLDDLGQAPASVQAACMQLLLAREINGKKISDKVVIFAATNRKEDRCGVTGMLEAVKSRFALIVELFADIDCWSEWAIDNDISTDIIAFLRFRPELLHKFEPTNALVNQPSPRTWENANKVINYQLPNGLHQKGLTGAVGAGAAQEFVAFCKLKDDLPNLDAILLNPTNAKLPKTQGAKYAVATGLAAKATKNSLSAAVSYMSRIDEKEFLVLFAKDMARRDSSIFETEAGIKLATDKEFRELMGTLTTE